MSKTIAEQRAELDAVKFAMQRSLDSRYSGYRVKAVEVCHFLVSSEYHVTIDHISKTGMLFVWVNVNWPHAKSLDLMHDGINAWLDAGDDATVTNGGGRGGWRIKGVQS